MGFSKDYTAVPDWTPKSEGYQAGSIVKYRGSVFYANFWASEPSVGDPDQNGWRFYDELYDLTPHWPAAHSKVIAYIPTWRKSEGFDYANDTMYQNITNGVVAFLMFSESSLGELDAKALADVNAVLPEIVAAGHRNGTAISIALGGATDFGFLNLMNAIGGAPDGALADRVVQRIAEFVRQHDLDGVDLDLECWWGKPGEQDQGGRKKSDGPHPAGRGLAMFAEKLRRALPNKLLSAAVFGTSWYGNNYDPALAQHVDWLGVMTYDLTGSWSASPVGPHSAVSKIRPRDTATIQAQAIYQESYMEEQQGPWPGGGPVNNPVLSVEDMLWYWTSPLYSNWQGAGQGIARTKIAAGVPLYGYDFAFAKDPDELTGETPPGYRSLRYKDILSQFPDAHTSPNANIKIPGSTPRPAFISAPGNYSYAHNIYFETPSTATAKLKFLASVGVQGVIVWDITNDVWDDGKSIVKALYAASGNPAKSAELGIPNFQNLSTTLPSRQDGGMFNNAYGVCFAFNLQGQDYIFGHKLEKDHGSAAPCSWFIRQVNDGFLGSQTDAGQWKNAYGTCFPFSIGGRTFVFGHKLNNAAGGNVTPGYWFIQELLPGGKLGSETDTGQWKNVYGTCFPFSIGGRTYLFGHKTSNDQGGNVTPGYWFIQELLDGGKMGQETHTGQWKNAYGVCAPFSIDGRTFIFGHKLDNSQGGNVTPGYWFIQELLAGGKMGDETDTGQWQNAYGVCFPFDAGGRKWLFGHKNNAAVGGNVTPGYWFIQELLGGGKMGAETDTGQWQSVYHVGFPVSTSDGPAIFAHDLSSLRVATGGSVTQGKWLIQSVESIIMQSPFLTSHQPHDRSFQSYSVDLKPWIADLRSWRSYDPATIDGVGLLIGTERGQLVGELLKSRTCEVLQPGDYTWVYEPRTNSIIYKYWDKSASRDDYVRHSQLGSGQPVICAGEFWLRPRGGLLVIEQGIALVNDASGHYKPDGGACLRYVAQKLQSIGISTDSTLWSSRRE